VLALATTVGAGVVGYLRLTTATDDLINRQEQLQVSMADQQARLDASDEIVGALAERLNALEGKATETPASIEVTRAAKPSVFTIVTDSGSGSGFVVSGGAGGSRLLTNFHVVSDDFVNGETAVTVTRGSTDYPGRVVDVSEANDLALVEVSKRLPALEWSQEKLPVGEPVLVLGSPLGLGGTVTSGIVSAYRTLDATSYLQFSAPISPGNSGGPVLDTEGRVVGVTVQKMVGGGAEGLGFAIPVDRVCAAFDFC
jgi:putative serine protease PepD